MNSCSRYKATRCHMRISIVYDLTRYCKIKKGGVVVRTYIVKLPKYETMYVCIMVDTGHCARHDN
jgi:hypothetical protein